MLEVEVNVERVKPTAPTLTRSTSGYQYYQYDTEREASEPKPQTTSMHIMGRPKSMVPKPIGLKVGDIDLSSYLKEVAGKIKPGYASSLVTFQGSPGRKLYLYVLTSSGELINEWEETIPDSGKVSISTSSDEEISLLNVASYLKLSPSRIMMLGDRVNMLPFAALTKITFWGVKTEVVNKTDIWARWMGRAVYRTPLPFYFWKEGYAIALAGTIAWRSIVPASDGKTVRYQVGVSAYCNTPSARPSHSQCCDARKKTWWTSKIYARSSPSEEFQEVGEDDINISFHNTATFTSSSASYEGKCLACEDHGLCGWEQGTCCE